MKKIIPLLLICLTLTSNIQVVAATNSNDRLSISKIVQKLSPSVVGIIGKLKQSSSKYSSQSDNLIFGTGVIYKKDGYIVTNSHVVSEMEKIVVVLSNGKAYLARLKANDELLDLAVIKIDKGGLTPAKFGNETDIVVGDEVLAIGTPLSFSLRNSVSSGIISGINRSAEGKYRFIQSDASINGGNSGGPLVSINGMVIGINTVKYTGFGVEGLSFSIPIDTVKYAIDHFDKYGKIKRPYLGVEFSEGVAAKYGLPSNEGLSITEVKEDSPAKDYDLQIDDVLLYIDNVKVTTIIDYYEEIKKYLPGDKVSLTIERNGELLTKNIIFSEEKTN